jgi:hypothetical protein
MGKIYAHERNCFNVQIQVTFYSGSTVFKIYIVKQVILYLCDLVVRVPGYRSRGPGSIPSATGFSVK